MDNMNTDDFSHWHLDRRVPIALMLTIAVQTAAIVWWASSLSERVNTLERQIASITPQADRITRLEVNIEFIRDGISDIRRIIAKPPQ